MWSSRARGTQEHTTLRRRPSSAKAPKLLVSLLLIGTMTESAAGQPPPVDQTATQLREFVERLFTPYHGTDKVRLLPGQLPGNLPFALPVPPQSRVAGSVVYSSANDKLKNVNIVLDVPGMAASMLSFYQSELATRGWSVIPPGPGVQQGPQPGFQVAPNTTLSSQNFCHDANKTLLWVTVSSKPTGLNDVRLNVEMTPSTLCTDAALATGSAMLGGRLTSSRSSLSDMGGADRNAGSPQHPQDINPLPPLFAPEGVSFSSQGGGGGSGC